jgi:hypothetical protein
VNICFCLPPGVKIIFRLIQRSAQRLVVFEVGSVCAVRTVCIVSDPHGWVSVILVHIADTIFHLISQEKPLLVRSRLPWGYARFYAPSRRGASTVGRGYRCSQRVAPRARCQIR